jgi:hypothetical protein
MPIYPAYLLPISFSPRGNRQPDMAMDSLVPAFFSPVVCLVPGIPGGAGPVEGAGRSVHSTR